MSNGKCCGELQSREGEQGQQTFKDCIYKQSGQNEAMSDADTSGKNILDKKKKKSSQDGIIPSNFE